MPATTTTNTEIDTDATMGVLFSKPLTKEDLAEALAPIKKDIGAIKEDLQAIKGALLVPDGDAIAKSATVQIRDGRRNLRGHGLIVEARGKNGVSGTICRSIILRTMP